MWKGFKVIDADAHMHEPEYLWERYVEPEYRDQVPRVVGMNGINFIYEPDGKLIPHGKGRTGHPSSVYEGMKEKYGEAMDEWWSPEIRIKEMDRFGWDIQVILPTGSNGNFAADVSLVDPKLGAAMSRAYHNWCHEYCSVDSNRMKFTAVLPAGDVDEMLTEARRAVEELGAASVRNPLLPEGKWLHHPEYDPMWLMASDLDFPITIHGEYQRRRFQPFTPIKGQEGAFGALDHAIGFAFDNMATYGHFVFGGVLERFPKLRLGLLESNAGWVPFWLGRLDDHAGGRQSAFMGSTPLNLKPSEYFTRQCIISADADEVALKYTVDFIGDDLIVFNTDYPHPDAPDPRTVMTDFMDQPISEESKRKILWDNAIRLYGPHVVNGVTSTA